MPHKLPGHATVVAYAALFIALGGSSYAAINLGRNSVKTRNIARGAVRSRQVRDHSLLARDFALGQLPAGVQGDKGDKGDPGTSGTPGADGTPGTARAYGLVNACGSGSCPITHNKGIDYAIEVAPAVFCVGVHGITPDDSVAIVSNTATLGAGHVEWRTSNSACVSTEFEINTWFRQNTTVRNAANDGTVEVASPPHTASTTDFVIAIP